MIGIEWHSMGLLNGVDGLTKIVATIDGRELRHLLLTLAPPELLYLGEPPCHTSPASEQLLFFSKLAKVLELREDQKKKREEAAAVFDNGIVGRANDEQSAIFLSHVVDGYRELGGEVRSEYSEFRK